MADTTESENGIIKKGERQAVRTMNVLMGPHRMWTILTCGVGGALLLTGCPVVLYIALSHFIGAK